MVPMLATQIAGKDILSQNFDYSANLNICNAVQELLHPAVVDVVGPVDEVLVDVHLHN